MFAFSLFWLGGLAGGAGGVVLGPYASAPLWIWVYPSTGEGVIIAMILDLSASNKESRCRFASRKTKYPTNSGG